MPAAIFSYSAVITKMRAMARSLLTRDDYDMLMSMGRVGEIVHYLKGLQGYGHVLRDISETSVHRNKLESALQGAMIDDARKLAHMLGRSEQRMLEVFMSRIEITMLKRILRAVYTGQRITEQNVGGVYAHTRHFDKYACLEATSFTQLLDALEGSGYDKVLTPYILRSDRDEIESTFDMEEALDEYYFTRLRDAASLYLSRTDAKRALDFFGAETDVQNLLWAYRYKKYYNFSLEDTVNHLLPNRYRIRREQLLRIASAEPAEFEREVARTRYGQLFAGTGDTSWDKRVADYLYKLYDKQLRGSSYSFASLMAFLFLREIDIQNIITIIEGVRYGMEPSQIKVYIVAGVGYGN